ncbi:hypothetical protein N9Z02_01805, partial [Akkermansiaceae bacterium]|nr:hypothetical protein [Akkermansiaceae bacterium]
MSEEPEEEVKPRRRKWPWILFILFLILIAGILWLNGPGARLIIEKNIPGQLEKLGLTGNYQIDGQIHRGFTLTNIDLTGDQLVKRAKADLIQIDYQLSEVISGKAQALKIHGLELDLNLDELPESSPDKEEPAKPLMETLNSIRGFVEPVDIDLLN